MKSCAGPYNLVRCQSTGRQDLTTLESTSFQKIKLASSSAFRPSRIFNTFHLAFSPMKAPQFLEGSENTLPIMCRVLPWEVGIPEISAHLSLLEAEVRGTSFGNTLPCLKDDTQCKALTLFQWPSPKCVACFEAVRHGFPLMGNTGPRANQHGNMSCFGGSPTFVFVDKKLRIMKHEPRNLNLETNHPPNMSHFSGWPSTHFNARQPKPPKHILTKTCNNFGSYVLTPCAHLPCSPMRYPSMKLLTFFNFTMLRLTFVKLLYQDN